MYLFSLLSLLPTSIIEIFHILNVYKAIYTCQINCMLLKVTNHFRTRLQKIFYVTRLLLRCNS